MFLWFPCTTPELSECQYNITLPEVCKQSLGNNLGPVSFLLGIFYGFRITSRASGYKVRNLIDDVITSELSYPLLSIIDAVVMLNKEKREKMKIIFWIHLPIFDDVAAD